jgi:hypothetical protein
MMAVGACDAYFCDAYADLIARTLQAKEIEPRVAIPDRLNNLRIPVIAVIREMRGGWRWRMAAREMIERENVLSLGKIKELFNHFFRDGRKLMTADTIEVWMLHRESRQRLFGITPTAYRALAQGQKGTAKKSAIRKFEERFQTVFQRRHDSIHNCDRPKMALQHINDSTVEKQIQDIQFLVMRCHEALSSEFPEYLRQIGFNGVTRNRVCA